MSKSKLVSVNCGKAKLPSDKVVEVGSKLWFYWLDQPETKSFRFNDEEGYTARKETANGYWYAYRKVEGKLHKRYIGVSEALTVERLAEVGELFSVPSQPKLPKVIGNLVDLQGELHNQLICSLEANNLELHNQVTQLKDEVMELRSQLSSQTAPQLPEIVELPEAATLLSQLRSRRKKSKADLADVEAVLEMVEQCLIGAAAGKT